VVPSTAYAVIPCGGVHPIGLLSGLSNTSWMNESMISFASPSNCSHLGGSSSRLIKTSVTNHLHLSMSRASTACKCSFSRRSLSCAASHISAPQSQSSSSASPIELDFAINDVLSSPAVFKTQVWMKFHRCSAFGFKIKLLR